MLHLRRFYHMRKSIRDLYVLKRVWVHGMLDHDLAAFYGYEVRALNQQVKRNIGRFPDDFMFQLTKDEVEAVKSQFATSPNSKEHCTFTVVVIMFIKC